MKLTGNLEDLGLGEILQILNFSSKSGVLRLSTAMRSGLIVLQDGCVVKATSDTVKNDICDLLVKEGAVTAEQVEKARSEQAEQGFTTTLGGILINDFGVSEDVLSETAKRLIEKIVYSFFLWKEGNFVFELGEACDSADAVREDPVQYTLARGLSPQFLAMEGLRLLDEASRAVELSVSTEAAPEETSSFEPVQTGPEAAQAGEADQGQDVDYRPGGSYINDLLSDIGEEVMVPEPGEETVSKIPESKGLKVLKEMLEELAMPLSLNEIILLILRFSSEIISRSVVFAVKKESIVGFGQFGIELDDEAPDNRVRNMKIPVSETSILNEAVEKKKTVKRVLDDSTWDEYIVEQLGGTRPREAFVTPIVARERVVMLVYGDNLPEDRMLDDLSALELFLCQTSKALDGLLAKSESVRKAV